MALSIIHDAISFDHDDDSTNEVIAMYWNDVTSAIEVYSWSGFRLFYEGFLYATLITSGETMPDETKYYDYTNNNLANLKFCTGTTLSVFNLQTSFPYCYKTDIANSPSCLPTKKDIVLLTPVYITNESTEGAGDAEIYIKAYTTNSDSISNMYFSKDGGSSFQNADNPSGSEPNVWVKSYSSLSSGTYTIQAKDNSGFIDEVIITIEVEKVYNTRYSTSYTGLNGIKTNIYLKELNYTGTSSDLLLSSDPFVETFGTSGDEIYSQIRSRSIDLNILIEYQGQYNRLFTYRDKQFKLVIEKEFNDPVVLQDHNGNNLLDYSSENISDYGEGTVTYFEGWVLPAFANSQYTHYPIEVSITAICGIASLSDEKFIYESNDIKGKRTFLNLIQFLLSKTGLDLDIVENTNIKDYNYQYFSPLTTLKVDAEIFTNEDNCFDVLKEILLGYSISQHRGKWLITPYNQRFEIVGNRYYGLETGIFNFEDYRIGINKKPGCSGGYEDVYFTDTYQANLEKDPPVKEQKIILDLSYEKGVIENGFFKEWDNYGKLIGFTGTAISKGFVEQTSTTDSDEIHLLIKGDGTSSALASYIKSDVKYIPGGQNYHLITSISADYYVTGADPYVTVYLKGYDFEEDVYLEEQDAGSALFNSDTENFIELKIDQPNQFVDLDLLFSASEKVDQIQPHEFYITQGVGTNCVVKSITVKYFYIDFLIKKYTGWSSSRGPYLEPIHELEIISYNEISDIRSKKDDINSKVGDLPGVYNIEEIIYKAGIFNQQNESIYDFKRAGITESKSYLQLIADMFMISHQDVVDRINTNISSRNGKWIDWANVLVINDTYFKINAGTLHDFDSTWNLELIEINNDGIN